MPSVDFPSLLWGNGYLIITGNESMHSLHSRLIYRAECFHQIGLAPKVFPTVLRWSNCAPKTPALRFGVLHHLGGVSAGARHPCFEESPWNSRATPRSTQAVALCKWWTLDESRIIATCALKLGFATSLEGLFFPKVTSLNRKPLCWQGSWWTPNARSLSYTRKWSLFGAAHLFLCLTSVVATYSIDRSHIHRIQLIRAQVTDQKIQCRH